MNVVLQKTFTTGLDDSCCQRNTSSASRGVESSHAERSVNLPVKAIVDTYSVNAGALHAPGNSIELRYIQQFHKLANNSDFHAKPGPCLEPISVHFLLVRAVLTIFKSIQMLETNWTKYGRKSRSLGAVIFLETGMHAPSLSDSAKCFR